MHVIYQAFFCVLMTTVQSNQQIYYKVISHSISHKGKVERHALNRTNENISLGQNKYGQNLVVDYILPIELHEISPKLCVLSACILFKLQISNYCP